MTTTATQLKRVVSLVSELSGRDREGHEGATFAELAERFDATQAQIQSDIRALTQIGDNPDADWLATLSVWQEGDRIHVSSAGAFRRPIRLTPDERLALGVGLALESAAGNAVSASLSTGLLLDDGDRDPRVRLAPAAAGEIAWMDLLRTAIDNRRCVELCYVGGDTRQTTRRVVRPHQLVGYRGHAYLVAWCDTAVGWRHFRIDRIVDASTTSQTFTPRDDFTPIEQPHDVFQGSDEEDEVDVRYSVQIARWVRERYPSAKADADGSVVVTFRVTSVDWLVQHVLQYGDEAEVLGPEPYREALRKAVE